MNGGRLRVLYLDANVFIYAALNLEDIGSRARAILKRVQRGEISATSSALTFDELVWAVKKYRSLADAAIAGEAFLSMPGLELIDVDGDLLAVALEIMRRYQLDPRDSIHAASALSKKAEAIISTDEHFDKFTEIKRRSI
ncbi:type II toxin-antitoxin system VapC family toxin [Candidatus Bathyarchaeota archaeon]|nr:type II toxin-antitoxin system VapC family toxin [Candidatus Bathyarchaeota archaeon]